jgi:RsiW-degrading membrane proteinase PrsW (M82 family)
MQLVSRIAISILPVAVFLVSLIFLDSYKLVRLRSILLTIAAGLAAAFCCLFINTRLMGLLSWEPHHYSRYIAPLVEELFKGGYIVYLITRRRAGFMVDAAIQGFAAGAGFAIAENVYNLYVLPDASVFNCILRGLGTAVMHGGTTALFGIIAVSLHERYESNPLRAYLPAFVVAAAVHSLFNHFLISPILSALGLVVGLPLIMLFVFNQSEKGLRRWLGVGFDTDADLLEMITTGEIMHTRIGEYLMSLRDRLPPEVRVDMFCLLRLHLELSIRAKGILLMRESGFEIPEDAEVREKFAELRFLEKSIGPTGRIAIMPFLRWSRRDLWQLYMLEGG